jgi:hypothetical protein
MRGGLVRIALYILLVTRPVWLATWLGKAGKGMLIDVGRNFALVDAHHLYATGCMEAALWRSRERRDDGW